MSSVHRLFREIKMFIFDVDGVFTNTNILITENNELLRTMTVRDGSAIKKALNAGYIFTIITKGASTGVKNRLLTLGIQEVFDQVDDKIEIFNHILDKYHIEAKNCLYMGDDNADIKVLQHVGLATCPFDAIPEVIENSAFISSRAGGEGCVRDVVERTMRIQGTW